jgi:hypothetical protein
MSGGLPMSVDQKKKLLWGKKADAEPIQAAPITAQAFGANRWDTAEFASHEDKERFIKLMVSHFWLCGGHACVIIASAARATCAGSLTMLSNALCCA